MKTEIITNTTTNLSKKNTSTHIKYCKSNYYDFKVVLMCIIVLITSNGFSQNHFIKRKYMKGVFIEKRQKINHLEKKHTEQKLFAKRDPLVEASKKNEIPELGKNEPLKDLVLFETTPVKKHTEVLKSEGLSVSSKPFYSNHNTFNITTDLQCSNLKSTLVPQKNYVVPEYQHFSDFKSSIKVNENKKMTNELIDIDPFWIKALKILIGLLLFGSLVMRLNRSIGFSIIVIAALLIVLEGIIFGIVQLIKHWNIYKNLFFGILILGTAIILSAIFPWFFYTILGIITTSLIYLIIHKHVEYDTRDFLIALAIALLLAGAIAILAATAPILLEQIGVILAWSILVILITWSMINFFNNASDFGRSLLRP